MRMVSKRPTTKQANEHTNGILPARARPAPMPIMFDSAIPTLNARSGCALANLTVIVDLDRSASSVTMRGSRAPRSSSASPKAARDALAGMMSAGSLLFVEGAQLVHERAGAGVTRQVLGPRGLAHAEDLADGRDGLLGLGRLAVPLGVVLHEGHALALDGVGHDQRRRAAARLGLVERLVDLGHVVAVDLQHRPVE